MVGKQSYSTMEFNINKNARKNFWNLEEEDWLRTSLLNDKYDRRNLILVLIKLSIPNKIYCKRSYLSQDLVLKMWLRTEPTASNICDSSRLVTSDKHEKEKTDVPIYHLWTAK